jgi:mannose-6-phosphate isomerase-like protein (cupin superfamily)
MGETIDKVNIKEKFALFDEHWSPKIVGELNGQHVKLVKLHGEFVWHHHEQEDELFLVLGGRLRMDFRDQRVCVEQESSSSCRVGSNTGPSPRERCT